MQDDRRNKVIIMGGIAYREGASSAIRKQDVDVLPGKVLQGLVLWKF